MIRWAIRIELIGICMTEYECAWWNYKMVKTSEVTFQFSHVTFTLRHFYFIQNFFPIFAIFLESHNQELHSDSGTIFLVWDVKDIC